MDHLSEQRRRAFAIWLRTGRLSGPDSSAVELKFNPWHDPADGRFTFAGTGRNFGPAGVSRGDHPPRRAVKVQYVEDRRLPPISTRSQVEAWRAEQLAKHGRKPGYREAIEAQYRRYLSAISWRSGVRLDSVGKFSGSGPLDQAGFSGGGGTSGGGGATGSWDNPASAPAHTESAPLSKLGPPRRAVNDSAIAGALSQAAASEQRQRIVRNGYTYEIDARNRMRRLSGVLSITDRPVRSRRNQAQAGGVDRRASDDGGHYIAARFLGPTEAFNHFAQDANFNRGAYRLLEEEWAREKRAGRTVMVKIVPRFDGISLRPSVIDVWWTVDGNGKSVKFNNERSERPRGK